MSNSKQNNEIFPGLIPAPNHIEFLDSDLDINEVLGLDYNLEDKNLIDIINLAKSEISDIGYKATESNNKGGQTILSIGVNQNVSESPESYRLKIDSNGIEIIGSDYSGAFYGMQTLLQILETIKLNTAKCWRVDIPHRVDNSKSPFNRVVLSLSFEETVEKIHEAYLLHSSN